MATTDPALAQRLVRELSRAGIRFAVMHQEERLATGSVTTDVDLVVDTTPEDVLPRLARAVGPDARLVLTWPYDIGSLTSYWLSTRSPGGAQLDLLHDPEGRAKYGLRTDVALGRSIIGVEFPRLRPTDETWYLIAKRWLKADRRRVRELALSAGPLLADAPPERVLSPPSARRVRRALAGADPPRHNEGWSHISRRFSMRGLRRLARPIGRPVPGQILDGFSADEIQAALADINGTVRVVQRDLTSHAGRALAFADARRPVVIADVKGMDRTSPSSAPSAADRVGTLRSRIVEYLAIQCMADLES